MNTTMNNIPVQMWRYPSQVLLQPTRISIETRKNWLHNSEIHENFHEYHSLKLESNLCNYSTLINIFQLQTTSKKDSCANIPRGKRSNSPTQPWSEVTWKIGLQGWCFSGFNYNSCKLQTVHLNFFSANSSTGSVNVQRSMFFISHFQHVFYAQRLQTKPIR